MSELRVLPHTSQADPVLAYCRTERAALDQLGQVEQLDVGLAVSNADWPDVPEANRLLLAATADDARSALDTATAAFADRSGRLLRVELDPLAPADRTQPLASELRSRGFVESSQALLYRRPAGAFVQSPPPEGVMILPTRAALRQAADLARLAARPSHHGPSHQADALLAALDDPHVDALIALHAGQPLGWVSVLAAGDVGRLCGLFVAPDWRRRGIGRMLLARAIEIATRSLFRIVVAAVDSHDTPTLALLQSVGFARGGAVRRFDLPQG